MQHNLLFKPELRNPTLIASLPDMGGVGGIASNYLVKKLRAEKFAEIFSYDKPWVEYRDGLVSLPRLTYRMYCDTTADLIIFNGDQQPERPRDLFDLCRTVMSIARSIAPIKRVYTIGGSRSDKNSLKSAVMGCANKPELLSELLKYGVAKLGSEIGTITWFNGVILGISAEQGIDAIGFYGEIDDPHVPQPLAVRNLLGVLITMGAIPEIDLGELEEEHRRVRSQLRKADA